MTFLVKSLFLNLALVPALILAPATYGNPDTTPPASPVKLIFIHHSTGGNWLADSNPDGPYGGLGAALRDNNYYVSATNYGWGPLSIGDRTDIPNWPEWFTGDNSNAILSALYEETGQNIMDYGSWPRLSMDPGGENEIILFKSCFPNSDLFGYPDDPPYTSPNDFEFSVSNAKAVYSHLLDYFIIRQDKLFVVITAPPLLENEYSPDYLEAHERAANARAFNNWLVNDWLSAYAHNNVAVFDYFNLLTHPENHHRFVSGEIEHYTSPLSGDFAFYPSYDSHPNTVGHQKATAEFAPLLNVFYNAWRNSTSPVSKPTVTSGAAQTVGCSHATLTGTLNPNGELTTYHFEYGETTDYGTNTSTAGAGAGTGSVAVDATISGLSPETLYHYRLVATNVQGTTLGEDMTFITSGLPVIFGNIDGSADGKVDLSDAVLALKICAGLTPSHVVSAAEVDGDGRIGLPEAIYALQKTAGLLDTTTLVQPTDLQYLGAFRLPDATERPQTFAYGGNSMTYNPSGDPLNNDPYPGSLFLMGHDRQPYGDLPDGNQVAEITIPAPVLSRDVNDLNQAEFLQPFHDVTQGYFTSSEEVIRTGMQYLDIDPTGPKIHLVWGCHFEPETYAGTHAWFNPGLSSPALQGPWRIGNQSFYHVTGYLFEIPASWADQHVNGKYLGTGRFRDGGWSGMGPALFAYRPWTDGGGTPPAPGSELEATTLLCYQDTQSTTNIEDCMDGYQHPDEWEGVAWITSSTGKTAVLVAGTKATGAKYWYGWSNLASPGDPCIEEAIQDQFTACRLADGTPCPPEDFHECSDHSDFRGWWSSRFDAQFIMYDPDDLAKVVTGEMNAWEPQSYAVMDIDEHLFLNPAGVEPEMLGTGDQRRLRIGPVTYDRGNDLLYVVELFADEAKPVVHVWKVL